MIFYGSMPNFFGMYDLDAIAFAIFFGSFITTALIICCTRMESSVEKLGPWWPYPPAFLILGLMTLGLLSPDLDPTLTLYSYVVGAEMFAVSTIYVLHQFIRGRQQRRRSSKRDGSFGRSQD